MATTATNKQPLLIDRVFHNAVEGNTLSSGSDTSLDILGTNASNVVVDCTGNDGGIIEDLYVISRTSSSATYTVLFYLSPSVDYLRPGEGIYIASVESSDTSGTVTNAVLPSILAPVAHVGDVPQLQALYVPKGKALWTTLQLAGPNNTADTPIIAAQGGYY
tara:strand:- start:453 stop:938 length:486 start_codon:yes stop_codon:yes gene_type:complete